MTAEELERVAVDALVDLCGDEVCDSGARGRAAEALLQHADQERHRDLQAKLDAWTAAQGRARAAQHREQCDLLARVIALLEARR